MCQARLHAPRLDPHDSITGIVISDATLATIPFLAELEPGSRQEIASTAAIRSYEAGEALWEMGERARCLFILLQGEVRVLRPRGDRLLLVHTATAPGTVLGQVPLFTRSGYPARAVAAAPTRCLIAFERSLRAAMAADPGLAMWLLRGLGDRVQELVGRLEVVTGGSVRERLAARILADAELSDGVLLFRYRSHDELATDLGTVREVVSREIGRLRGEGLLRSEVRGIVEIRDEARLRDLAAGARETEGIDAAG